MEETFSKLGYELTLAGNIPGFTAEIDTDKEGPTIAVFGEMDALICGSHPAADSETGAVHSCGHCAQAAALIGLAAALKEEGALDGMCGKIRLVAVPAEELIEIEYREELRKQGIIKYFGGKPEFMWRGLLNGVDMAFMIHTGVGNEPSFSINRGTNGCIAKTMTFKGVSSHAGGAPHKGVNALYAANLALNAVNALRETFIDDKHIRFHPIITHGGDAVNAIPETVTMESYVRGASMQEIVKVNKKINRAMAASAAAIGAKLHLRDIPGYWVRQYPDDFRLAFEEAAKLVVDNVKLTES
jgi:amidohydrolase